MCGGQGEVRTLHPRSQAAYADCGTRRGRAEMRGVYPKITPLLPFGLRTGRATLKPKLGQSSWTGTLPEPPRCEWGYSAPPGHGNRESWWAGQESTSLETDARPGTVWACPRVGVKEGGSTRAHTHDLSTLVEQEAGVTEALVKGMLAVRVGKGRQVEGTLGTPTRPLCLRGCTVRR